jgi:hypothetical protein
LLDAVTGTIGGRQRWRTMPWMVIIFGLAVGPLDAWCTLCLASAVVSLLMIGPALDEFLASLQYLKAEPSRGRSAWRAFWGLGDGWG